MDNPEEDFQKSETDQYFWIKLFLIFLYSFGNLDLIKVGKVQTRLLAYPVFAFGPRTNPCHRIWLPFTVKLFPILTTSYPYQIIPNLSHASNLDVPNWPNPEFGSVPLTTAQWSRCQIGCSGSQNLPCSIYVVTTWSIQKSSFINYWNKSSFISKNPSMLQVVSTGAYHPLVATTWSIFCL